MKIFFHTSQQMTTDPSLIELNGHIYYYLEELGHEHTSDFFVKLNRQLLYNPEVLEKESKDLWRGQKQKMKNSDVFFVGPSEQSLGIG